MKSRSTFRIIDPNRYKQESINSDVVFVEDHIPYYEIDHSKPKEVLIFENKGQNMLVDFAIDPQNTIWIYDSYLMLENNLSNIFLSFNSF